MTLDRLFLGHSSDKLKQLSGRIAACLDRLTSEQVWARSNDNQNAVGNLVLHLCGNVRQWIGHGVAGLPDIRQRDAEFAAREGVTPQELAARLSRVVDDAVAILKDLPAERLRQQITVQNYHLTVLEGIYHVVAHFSEHTGQIIFATKWLTGEDLGFYRHLLKPTHDEAVP